MDPVVGAMKDGEQAVWGSAGFITRDQFVYFVTLAREKGDPADWPRFRVELVDALTAAWGLDTRWTDLDRDAREGEVAQRRRRAFDLVDQVRSRHDPLCDWDRFFDALWEGRARVREPL